MGINWETNVKIYTPYEIRALDRKAQINLLEALHNERQSILHQGFCADCSEWQEDCRCEPDPPRTHSAAWIAWAWGIAGMILGAWIFALVWRWL